MTTPKEDRCERVERAIAVLHAEGDDRYDEVLREHVDCDCDVCTVLMDMILDEDSDV